MIHFDTNALIALPHWAREGHPVISRVLNGEPAAASTLVWYEYQIGPLAADEAMLAHAFLQGRIAPVTEEDAIAASTLLNAAGRRRGLKTDALIAAAAIRAKAELVTLNIADFQPFAEHGLRLIPG